MNKNILICGVGGQGTVLASKIIAASAMVEGDPVHSAETIGMAQRGGSVTSHVRIGQADAPLIPLGGADLLLAFEPAEAVRSLPYLKKDGLVIVSSVPVKPVTESLQDTGYDGRAMLEYLGKKCRCIIINAERICQPLGSARYFNIAMLGAAVGTGRLGIPRETVLAEMEKRVPSRYLDTNKAAFDAGYEAGESYEVK